MRNIIKYKDLVWMDIIDPTQEDIDFLEKELKLHPVTLRNVIPTVLHPDFNIFEDYVSLILHYPRNEDNGDVELHEIDIIAGKNYIVTSHYKPLRPINYIWDECASSEMLREKYMGKGTGQLLSLILNKILKRILEKTDKICGEVAAVEKEIFTADESKLVQKISYLKRKIISFWRATDPQGEVFANLKLTGANFFGPENKYYFADLFRLNQTINSSLEACKETIESLENTNHSMINLKRTEVMKILTIVSVIFMPLTLIASMWGMNTTLLPFRQFPYDFLMIIGIMLIVLVGMLSYFKIKKWL
jgi:magnesium transporter